MNKVKADIEITLEQLESESKQIRSAAHAGGISQPEEDARRAIEDSRSVWHLLNQDN
jgi:hypothetical protein